MSTGRYTARGEHRASDSQSCPGRDGGPCLLRCPVRDPEAFDCSEGSRPALLVTENVSQS